MPTPYKLILASESPRRRSFLTYLGLPFDSVVSGADETIPEAATPSDYVSLVSMRKANAVLPQLRVGENQRLLLVAADTTVALGGQILGKPDTPDEAEAMLLALRDRTHDVHTGLTVVDVGTRETHTSVHTAHVTMRPYTRNEISQYVATGAPMDKAGAYGIQDPIFRPVSQLDGCFLGVAGLSLCHLVDVLNQMGLPPTGDMGAIRDLHAGYPCPLYAAAKTHYF